MSHQAVCWALEQPVKHAPAKHILTVMAHYVREKQSAKHGGAWVAFPSVSQLVLDTGQDRKTVMVNIKRLLEQGYIVDTGMRAGDTKRVPIYRLGDDHNGSSSGTIDESPNSADSGTAFEVGNSANSGTFRDPEDVPEQGPLNGTNFPYNGTEIGTHSSGANSTNFSGKQSQFPPETVPVFPTEQEEQVRTGNRARGTRLPANWILSKKLGEWALGKNPAWTRDDIREQADAFRDYWTAATGRTSTKRDWDAAWRTWIRKALEFSGQRPVAHANRPHETPWEGAL